MGAAPNSSLGAARARGKVFWFVMLASLGAAFAASPFGCGLDDSAVDQIGVADGSTDTSFVEGEGGPIGDGGADVIVCNPDTCNNFPSVCRAGIDNGCGGTVDCTNACPAGHACIKDSGTCDGPPVCLDAGEPGGNCGEIVNPGNQLDASCGACANTGYTCLSSTCTCAAGGTVCGSTCCNGATPNCDVTPNACCKLFTCAANYAGFCNNASANNCGANTLDCSNNCTTVGQACAPDKVCDTTPVCNNKDNPGGNCGTLTSTHGLTTNCGTCNNAYACTGTPGTCTCANAVCSNTCCTPGQICSNAGTCCTENSMSTTCNNVCGTGVIDNCGQSVNCPTACNVGDDCEGSSCDCSGHTCASGDMCCFGGGVHFCHSGGKCF